MMISYGHWIRFRNQTLGLVWQTDDGTGEPDEDTDCVLTDGGRVVTMSPADGFEAVADRHGLALEKGDQEPQNLDGLDQLLELPASEGVCAQVLNAWNLFNDIARSLGASLDDWGPEASACYDKLFYGNNLESITPAGEHYSPDFAHQERLTIMEILNRGRTILTAHL